eukprot:gene8530-9443_t
MTFVDPNNKDGNAVNVTKYLSALTSTSVRDVYCVENTKIKEKEFLQELSDVKETIEASQRGLSNEKMIVKPWKANELVFHGRKIQIIEQNVKELNNIHSKISANALTLKRKFPESITKSSETKRRKTRQAENKKKSKARKKKRLGIKCQEVCKIVAPNINFDEVAAKNVQVTEESLNNECAPELSVRFRVDELRHSLESDYFDKGAEVFVKRLLENLESLKESRRKLRKPRRIQTVKVHLQILTTFPTKSPSKRAKRLEGSEESVTDLEPTSTEAMVLDDDLDAEYRPGTLVSQNGSGKNIQRQLISLIYGMFPNLSKKVTKIGKKTDCEKVLFWMRGTKNHLYWSAQTTRNGFCKLILAKWKSILNHVANEHSQHEYPLFRACAHTPIAECKKWIKIVKGEEQLQAAETMQTAAVPAHTERRQPRCQKCGNLRKGHP